MSIIKHEAHRLAMRKKKNVLRGRGFTTAVPTEPGEYVVACNETDYDMYRVAVVLEDGIMVVIDTELGAIDVNRYGDGLTDIMWRLEDDE